MRWPLGVLACAILIVGVVALRRSAREERAVDDLTNRFAEARKQPSESAFDLTTLPGEDATTQCIKGRGPTRLTYHVTVPEDAAFAVRVVFVPTDRAVDGVGYLVGVSDGHTYRTIDTATVGGRAARAQQREVRVRLDEYAGMTINLVLNTRPLNLREAADVTALWCSPRIIAAR